MKNNTENDPNNNSKNRPISIKRNTVLFGSYPQGPNGEVAPIEWRVINRDYNTALLVSKHALDARNFDTRKKGVDFDGNWMWAVSDIRRWLNTEFLEMAFTHDEQLAIFYYGYDMPEAFEVEDQVFLLDVDEMKEFSVGKCTPTEYAKARGAECEGAEGTCRWWLKSHSRRAAPYTAMTMGSNGKVDYAGADVTSAILAVRPAISVDFSDIYRLLDPDDDPVSGTDVAKTSRETVVFGSYPKGPDCKLEPVEWEVLEREGDTALVISKYGIDVQPFHTDGCEWKDSDLRDWLNNWFIRDAFTDEERGRILETKVLTREGGMDTDEGSFTLDKLFLLDRNEALRYFGSDADRICNLTGYSEACNGYRAYKGRGGWWLRNQGVDYGTAIVEEDGSLDELGTVSASIDIAVRPVMRISLREDGGGREKTETDAKGVGRKEPATIFFGKYPQEPEGDMVPIEWRILVSDGEKALLVTKKAIEVLEFDNDRYYSECLKGCPDEKRWWADSFLRVWLNNCFVDNAFTDEERAKILYVTLNRDWSRAEKRSGEQIPDGGEKTDNGVVVFPGNEYYFGNLDRVFLLGEEETERYFESRYDMACLPTELAKSCGVYKTRRYSVKGVPTCPWWMNGNDGKGNKVFHKSGYNYWMCHAGDTAVRPAMWVTADALGDDNKGGD